MTCSLSWFRYRPLVLLTVVRLRFQFSTRERTIRTTYRGHLRDVPRGGCARGLDGTS